jgi:hypothetical protein
MRADDAADFMDRDRATDRFKQRAAIGIAILAMLLAVTGLGGQNATKEALNSNIQAANLYSFFQSKSIRQTSFTLAADTFELAFWAIRACPSPPGRLCAPNSSNTGARSPATSRNLTPRRARRS